MHQHYNERSIYPSAHVTHLSNAEQLLERVSLLHHACVHTHTHKYAADLTLHNLILALPNTKLLTFMRHHISYSYSLRKSYCHACHLLHSSRFCIARLHPATHTCARAHTRTQYKMEITSSGKFHLGQADITSRPFLSSKVIHKCTRAHTATNLLIQKHMCRGRALAAALQRRRKKGGH